MKLSVPALAVDELVTVIGGARKAETQDRSKLVMREEDRRIFRMLGRMSHARCY